MENIHDLILKLWDGTGREGTNHLLFWLEIHSDFFQAPCSAKFHLAERGGLAQHSLNVYRNLQVLALAAKIYVPEDTLIILGLGHDLCKVNFYGTEYRNVKNDKTGQWERKPVYVVKDQYPYGHGEKSVDILTRFIPLSDEERLAIRWHMGGWTEGDYSTRQAMSAAARMTPLVPLLWMADLQASYITENERGEE
jgi:hypothetical protein